MWCIYAVEYYSAIKRNEFESVVLRWRNLEPIMQNEAVRKRKANIVYQCIYMESKKVVLMNLFAGKEWRYKRTCGPRGIKRGWDELRK